MTLNSSAVFWVLPLYSFVFFQAWPLELRPFDHVCAFGGMDVAVSGGKPSTGKGVRIVCSADMTRTFEFVLYFIRSDKVTVPPNHVIIIN